MHLKEIWIRPQARLLAVPFELVEPPTLVTQARVTKARVTKADGSINSKGTASSLPLTNPTPPSSGGLSPANRYDDPNSHEKMKEARRK